MKAAPITGLLLSPLSILALSAPVPIFTLPGPVQPASWFENIAVRPNGKILATRGDAPEIWQIDPATGQGGLLVSVEGAFNLTGIAEVSPHERPQASCLETYVFGSSHIPAPMQIEPGSAKVWTLQFSANGNAAPTVSLLAAMPSAGFINGIAAWGKGRVLLSDTVAQIVYLMDVETGAYTTPLTGLTGINGIKTAQGYIYRADHLSSTLSRIPVGPDAVAMGPAEVLATNQSIDDFSIVVDAFGKGKAYIAAMYDVEVVEVTFGPAPSSGPGVKRVVAENLSGTETGISTATAFGRRPQDSGLLYATIGQGGASAAIVRFDPTE
ncbi:hypothetical protein N657DRAFT_639603 [Parathielavia appendiculata]|uniref:Uncharacterized protein n=1 Tax=Parathielavia appendiculata TaxID=2587402 RepID=A0AAN6UAR4_9PEZI|nr:hypothetical protein N657DRAFT_639603 [Parathielavia appendiculata]